MGKFKKGMFEEPQLTEKEEECQTNCSPVRLRGGDTEDDYRADNEAKEPPTTAKEDYETLLIKEEDLEDYYGEGDKLKVIPSDLVQPTDNLEYQTDSMNEEDFDDEWIEDDESEEQQPADEEGLPYHVHIKEEVSEDEYQEDDTVCMQMAAHSSSKQDGSSDVENSNNIVISTQLFTRAQKEGRPHIESDRKGKVSEENVPLKSVPPERDRSMSSTHRTNQKDYFQVVCVEEVDTMDPDLNDEDGQMNSPGEICCGEEIHRYSSCNTRLPDESSPSRHDLGSNAREKMFECPDCHKRYTEKRSLMRHMEAHLSDMPHKCSLCGKEFSSEGRLQAHVRGHTAGRSFECSYCNKGFTDKCGLTRHIRTHTGEKPYKCSLCDRSFSVKGNLAQHMKTHTGEKPFTCAICDKHFLHQSWLSRHIYRAHSGVRIKPFQCCLCDKNFSQNSDLTRHMKTHTRKKFFQCSHPNCSKTFSTIGNFSRHEKTHMEAVAAPGS